MNFLFADNTTPLRKGTSIIELGNFVNLEVQELGMILRADKLAINTTLPRPKQKKS